MSSKASSRSSSAHSRNSSRSASPMKTEPDASVRAAAQPEAPDDATQMLLLVLNGRAPALGEFCTQLGASRSSDLCRIAHDHDGKQGTVFYFAARKNERGILRTLCTACAPGSSVPLPPEASPVLEPLLLPCIRSMIDEEKFSVVVFLMSLCPTVGLQIVNPERGDTLLHALCRCPTIPAWCVQDVLAMYVGLLPPIGEGRGHAHSISGSLTRASSHSPARSSTSRIGGGSASSTTTTTVSARRLPHINSLNHKGWTALHVAATHIRGLAGGQIAKMLLRHGADESILTPTGQSVLEVCLNGHVRGHLGIVQSRHRGREAKLDEETKQKIDACATSDAFPVLPEITEESVAMETGKKSPENTTAADDEEEGRKKGDPLSAEDEEALVQRLYEQSTRQKGKWFEERYRELEAADQQRYHAKQLAADEVEASVSRLYQESMDKATEKIGELNEKYLKARPPGPSLEPEELEACCQRLCAGSLEKKTVVRKELQDKFYPPKEKIQLSKSAIASSALRLCTTSQEKSAQEQQKLYDMYCGAEKGRFNGGQGPLSMEQMKALGDRLSKK